MKKTIFRFLLFISINIVIAVIGLWIIHIFQPDFNRNDTTTEATFSAIPTNQHFDFVIMGTSHAREFSRSGNKQLVEKTLHQSIFNLSKGMGHGGFLPNKAAWTFFEERDNTTKKLIYFVDPWVFYSKKWNEENYFLEDEPIRLDILQLAVRTGLSTGTFVNYFKSKLKPSYFLQKPISSKPNVKFLTKADTALIRKQNERNYLDGLNQENFNNYTQQFKVFIENIVNQGIDVRLVLPPTLLGKEPAYVQMKQFLESLKGVKFFDHTMAIPQPEYYYDLHHLNSKGVMLYIENHGEVFE